MRKKKYTSHPCSEETKEKLRNRVIKPEWKQRQKESMIGHKISQETKDKISKSMTGKKWSKKTREKNSGGNAFAWKGGVTSVHEKVRKSFAMVSWKKAVYKRDDYTCQKNKVRGNRLHAHHIKNFADFPELRLEIDNGITLSEKAHKEFHQIYGKKNNNRKQLEEFLNIEN